MLKILVKKQLTEIFRSYFYDAKNNKARSKGATAAYLCFFAVLMIAVLGGIFASMAFSLCLPLSAAGADWLYFAVIGLIAILLGTFGSVFSTYSLMVSVFSSSKLNRMETFCTSITLPMACS